MGGAFYDIGDDTVPSLAVLNTTVTSCTENPYKIHNNDFIIFPNPFIDNITIQIPDSYVLSETKFTITNTLGQVLFTFYPESLKQLLNLSTLSSGMYFITIQNVSDKKTFKIIKQ
jgi:hypothetical protein